VFGTLHNLGLFEATNLYDRIAMLFTYMHVLDQDLRRWIRTWNNHRIRSQSNRPHVIPGVPYTLFHHPDQFSTEDYSQPVPPDILSEMDSLLAAHAFDQAACLTPAVKELCEGILERSPPRETEHGRVNGVDIPYYHRYVYIREKLEAHFLTGDAPELVLPEAPVGGIRRIEEALRARGIELDDAVYQRPEDYESDWDLESEID
jgi:hypothetical protein